MNTEFGGNVYAQDINKIMLNNAKRFKLNYSHKKSNRWNMWRDNSGMTLSFVIHNGLFIPSISGLERKTLTKFYNTSGSDIDAWIKSSINDYFSVLTDYKEVSMENTSKITCEEDYWKAFYQNMRMMDEDLENLTDEELESMYHHKQSTEEVKQLRKTRKKNTQIPGQMSIFDYE